MSDFLSNRRLAPARRALLAILGFGFCAAAGPAAANDSVEWLDRTLAKSSSQSGSTGGGTQMSLGAGKASSANPSTKWESGAYEGESKPTGGSGVSVASLGNAYGSPAPSLSGGGGISWAASSDCLDGGLKSVIANVAANYGSVTVTSTCRSRAANSAAGGGENSYHLSGNAADFRVHGNVSGAAAYLSGAVGGYRHMGGGLFHIDTGPRRPF